MFHHVTDTAVDGSVSQFMATDARFHRNLLLLPQDLTVLNLSMTSLTFHIRSHMLLMAEEYKLREFVEANPGNTLVHPLV